MLTYCLLCLLSPSSKAAAGIFSRFVLHVLLQVRDWYVESFKDLREFPAIKDDNDEQKFTDLLRHIYHRHRHVVPVMAMGVAELKKELQEGVGLLEMPEIHQFLDGFYLSRIGIRILIGQHIALHEPEKENYIGTACFTSALSLGNRSPRYMLHCSCCRFWQCSEADKLAYVQVAVAFQKEWFLGPGCPCCCTKLNLFPENQIWVSTYFALLSSPLKALLYLLTRLSHLLQV